MRLRIPSSIAFSILAFTTCASFSATTDPVGAMSVTIPAGTTILSAPFQSSIEFQGPVTSVSGSDVSFGSTVPALTGPHYLQIISGADVGRIYTIDSTLDSTVTLVESPSALSVGDVVALRKYFTVSDLGAVPNGTTVTLLNPGASPTIATFFFGSWTPSADVHIAPGEGFVVNTGSAFDVVFYGAVCVDDVVFEASAGSTIVGNLNPIDGSQNILSGIIASAPNGATLTELVAGAPIVYTYFFGSWNPDPSGIDISNGKTFVFNSGFDIDIVNPGFVIP